MNAGVIAQIIQNYTGKHMSDTCKWEWTLRGLDNQGRYCITYHTECRDYYNNILNKNEMPKNCYSCKKEIEVINE